MQHTHLSASRFSSYKAACNVHGVNGCPTCTPCTTGDRIIMWFVYVIAWLGVKFGINFTSVVVRMAKIARGEAECNLPF